MNKKTVKTVVIVLLVILILASVAFYISDILLNQTPITENLFKVIAAVSICAAALIRTCYRGGGRRKRKTLDFYQSQYRDKINNAFINEPAYKKELLSAIRLYNEDRFGSALGYLSDLKQVCKTNDDIYAVFLFEALILTELNRYNDAIDIYNQLIEHNIVSSTVYGNLGNIHLTLGNTEDAIANLKLAIQHDEKNPAPYNNLANLYFKLFDFENAKLYAEKALKINLNMYQASTLLAIIYSMEDDEITSKKYSHMAVSCGQNPTSLKNAIEYYRSEEFLIQLNKEHEEESETTEDETDNR